MSTEILDFRKMSTEEIKAKIKKDIEKIQEEVANGLHEKYGTNFTIYHVREGLSRLRVDKEFEDYDIQGFKLLGLTLNETVYKMYLNSTLYKEREIAAIKSNLNVQVGNMNIRRETENFIAQCNFIEDLK